MCSCGAGARAPSLSGTTVLPCKGEGTDLSALALPSPDPVHPPASQPAVHQAMLLLVRARGPRRDPSSQITIFSLQAATAVAWSLQLHNHEGFLPSPRISCATPSYSSTPAPLPFPPQICPLPCHQLPPHLPAAAPPGHPRSRDQQITCWPSRWPLCWEGGSGSRQRAPWPRSPWD